MAGRTERQKQFVGEVRDLDAAETRSRVGELSTPFSTHPITDISKAFDFMEDEMGVDIDSFDLSED
jgi:hypothetical protein